MATSKFYWHNTPIWAQLQTLGFDEFKTTFQGHYIGKAIAENDLVTISRNEQTTFTEIVIHWKGTMRHEYVRTAEYGLSKTPIKGWFSRGRLVKSHKGAYSRVLALIADPR